MVISYIAYFYRLTFGVSTAIYFCQKLFVYVTFADKSVLVNNRLEYHECIYNNSNSTFVLLGVYSTSTHTFSCFITVYPAC